MLNKNILKAANILKNKGEIPYMFFLKNPYKIKLNDPTNVHVRKKHRQKGIKVALSLKYKELPPMDNIDNAEEYNEGKEKL